MTTTPVRFVVTGFGPFQGVRSNPTTQICHKLDGHLRKHGRADLADAIVSRQVMETAAAVVRGSLDLVARMEDDTVKTVYLHLGVNARGNLFHVEECAYNDATFRVPDRDGYRPTKECIVEDQEWGHCLKTELDVEALVDTLNATETRAIVSTDPGRFVCNYTYYYSLSQHPYAIFLHVPPFAVAGEGVQLRLVADLMEAIRNQLVGVESA